MMKITKYLTAIVVISILSNHVKCASKKSDGTTLTKSGVMKTAFSEQKTAGEKMEQGTSIKIITLDFNQYLIMSQILRLTLIKFRLF